MLSPSSEYVYFLLFDLCITKLPNSHPLTPSFVQIDVGHVLVGLLLDDVVDEVADLLALAQDLEVEVAVEAEHDKPDVETDETARVDDELVEEAVDEVEADVLLRKYERTLEKSVKNHRTSRGKGQ